MPIDYQAWSEVTEALTRLGLKDYEELLDHFKVDFRRVGPKYIGGGTPRGSNSEERSIWGTVSRGTYADSIGIRSLQGVSSVEEVEAYSWPSPDWFDYSDIKAQCEGRDRHILPRR